MGSTPQTPLLPSRELARFAENLTLSSVPPEVCHRAKLHILDALGLGLASHTYNYSERALAGAAALSSHGTCSVIGSHEKLAVRDAAMVNGILIHGLDFDDTHLASIIHPTCTSLPCALSLGELLDVSGEDFLAAFLAGAETSIRIGGAVKGGFHHVGFHATGVVSHFASVITAGKLLGLDEDQLVSAQGITGSTASGIQVFLEEGAWTKRLHPGWGAVAGITAAQLAKHGYEGPTRPYEGRFGLFETHLHGEADRVDLDELTSDLGHSWRFGATALKPYPVCHFIHGCADAAIALHGEIAGEDITSVDAYLAEPTLHIVAEPPESKERPTTDYEAKFSAQFVIATCLLKGRFGLPELLPDALADPGVKALALNVRCHEDPDTAFPTYFSGGVTVHLSDGRSLSRHIRINSGAGDRALEPDAVLAKFMTSATMRVSVSQAEAIRDSVMAIEEAPGLSGLMASLRCGN